jgi:hypothetical protein
MMRFMGTKALRNKRRQREMEIAALNIPIVGNGQVLAPGSRDDQRHIKIMAEMLSEEELASLRAFKKDKEKGRP